MNNWPTLLATAAIQLVIAIFVYGKLSQRVAEHERRLDKSDDDGAEQWRAINRVGNSIEHVKGHLGINGRLNGGL